MLAHHGGRDACEVQSRTHLSPSVRSQLGFVGLRCHSDSGSLFAAVRRLLLIESGDSRLPLSAAFVIVKGDGTGSSFTVGLSNRWLALIFLLLHPATVISVSPRITGRGSGSWNRCLWGN